MGLEDLFPDLKASGYQATSPQDPSYNCVAWAAGHKDRWWESAPGYFWPTDAPFGADEQILILMLQFLGFEMCDGDGVEDKTEKVAIYGANGEYTHVARQLPSGQWTSKIGALEDITHNSLPGLVGQEYGTVRLVMKRPSAED